MEEATDRAISERFAAMSRDLQNQEGALVARLADLITREVADFRSGAVDRDDLHETVADRLGTDFRALQEVYEHLGDSARVGSKGKTSPPANVTDHLDLSGAVSTGARWARKGVPLSAIVAADRIAARFAWNAISESAVRHGVPDRILVAVASDIFALHDLSVDAVTKSYSSESRAKMRAEDAERSAFVGALLDGRTLPMVTVSEIAELLRLPRGGQFVVVIADRPVTARRTPDDVESKLRAANFVSSWRLTPDLQIGIVSLPRGERDVPGLAEILRASAANRRGISPVYDDLSNTAAALQLARAALRAALQPPLHVVAFDDSPLLMASVAEPDINARIARTVLAGLEELNAEQRSLLLDTLEAWINSAGLAAKTAEKLFIHRNTVRQRLSRLEALTGRSLSDPRDIAAMCIALATDRRSESGRTT